MPSYKCLTEGLRLGSGSSSFRVEKINDENIYLRMGINKPPEQQPLRVIPMVILSGIVDGLNNNKITIKDVDRKYRRDNNLPHLFDALDLNFDKFILGYDSSIIKICEFIVDNQDNQRPVLGAAEAFRLETFNQAIRNSGLQLDNALQNRFVASLCTKPFVLLTGLSGSGKTKLAQAFASWICESQEEQVALVPVGADWTNREPLLGYPNALEAGKYVKPDNGVVDLLVRASTEPDKPYFLILDEMNLSHVERYFADFLSTMESGKTIPLHAGTDDWSGVPPSIRLPQNLFIIGTVNVDETTYMFSPKVLDRANVIDFRVAGSEMEAFLSNPATPDLDALQSAGAGMAADFVRIAKGATPDSPQKSEINAVLMAFFNELKKTGAEFGYRTASEIHRLAGMLNRLTEDDGAAWETDAVIDAAVIQKLLPKVHGSRSKLEPVLASLAELCLIDGAAESAVLLKSFEDTPENIRSDDQVRFKQSLEKILRMRSRVIKDGFTSFAEA